MLSASWLGRCNLSPSWGMASSKGSVPDAEQARLRRESELERLRPENRVPLLTCAAPAVDERRDAIMLGAEVAAQEIESKMSVLLTQLTTEVSSQALPVAPAQLPHWACSQTKQTRLADLLEDCGDQLPAQLAASFRKFLDLPEPDPEAPPPTAVPGRRGRKGKAAAAAATPATGVSTRRRQAASGNQAGCSAPFWLLRLVQCRRLACRAGG